MANAGDATAEKKDNVTKGEEETDTDFMSASSDDDSIPDVE